jgi:hypothetical protein
VVKFPEVEIRNHGCPYVTASFTEALNDAGVEDVIDNV